MLARFFAALRMTAPDSRQEELLRRPPGPVDIRAEFAKIVPLRRALVVGRSRGKARRTGNSGANPGRPRRCNRAIQGQPLPIGPLPRRKGRGEKAGQTSELGSQKTYQRVTCGPLRGTWAAEVGSRLGTGHWRLVLSAAAATSH